MTHKSHTSVTPVRGREQRLRPPLQAHYPETDKPLSNWRAVAFRAGDQDFMIAASALLAVTPMPATITTLPGSVSWFSGLANTEHGVMAVTDLAGFIMGNTAKSSASGQLLLLNSPLAHTALLVDRVYGLHRLNVRPVTPTSDLPDDLQICCSATVMHQQRAWPLLNPFKLSAERRFMNITADKMTAEPRL